MSNPRPHAPLKLDAKKKIIETHQTDQWARDQYALHQRHERRCTWVIILLTFIVAIICVCMRINWQTTVLAPFGTAVGTWLINKLTF